MSKIHFIVRYVRQEEYYVPRDYQTIGGMWTVDKWIRDGIVLKVMDEGYTRVVEYPGLKITEFGSTVTFEEGSESDLDNLIRSIGEE